MIFSLEESAKKVGKNKTTLQRWIKSGKLSANVDENGRYRIDAAELFRAFPPIILHSNVAATDECNEPQREKALDATTIEELATLRAENRLLKEMTEDLRKRLDLEAEERRRLTYLLMDQTAKSASESVPEGKTEGMLEKISRWMR